MDSPLCRQLRHAVSRPTAALHPLAQDMRLRFARRTSKALLQSLDSRCRTASIIFRRELLQVAEHILPETAS